MGLSMSHSPFPSEVYLLCHGLIHNHSCFKVYLFWHSLLVGHSPSRGPFRHLLEWTYLWPQVLWGVHGPTWIHPQVLVPLTQVYSGVAACPVQQHRRSSTTKLLAHSSASQLPILFLAECQDSVIVIGRAKLENLWVEIKNIY